jgi:hypothetical protein
MANDVFANGREIACKAADGKAIAAFPDVCFTPPQTPATPPGVPIPYPNTAFARDTAKGSKSVKISGKEVILKNNSYFKTSTGDEAGCAPKKGVITSKIKGKAYYNSWSMDVKFEGLNVARHLDLTTHNHGSGGQTPPWPYKDAIAMDKKGHPCKKMAKDINKHCEGQSDYSKECCRARKCLLMPYDPNCCCKASDGRKMTPHHLLPSKLFVPHKDRGNVDTKTNYESNQAPCICLKGKSHAKRLEHGRVGTNYTKERNKWLNDPVNQGKTYTLAVGIEVAARSATGKVNVPEGSKGCDEACLKRQLEDGHTKMKLKIGLNDALPRAKKAPPVPKLD